MTYGLQVQYNGEHIGYILSESAFVEAEAKVRERIVNEAYLPPEDSVPIYSLAIVEDDQISEEEQKQNYEEILAWANDYDFLTDDKKS